MKILIISPYFPPDFGGVADYTKILITELCALSHSVTLITSNKLAHLHTPADTLVVPSSWKTSQLISKISKINLESYDFALIQYTPLSFAPDTYGNSLFLYRFFKYIKKRLPVYMMAHESNYPMDTDLKGLLIGLPNCIQFFVYSFFLDHIFFSHERQRKYWSRGNIFQKHKFSVLPIFSNISVQSSDNITFNKLSDDKCMYLSYFGGTHYSIQFDYFIESLVKIKKNVSCEVKLLMIGTNKESWGSRLDKTNLDNIIFCGRCSEQDVSYYLSKSTLVLLPFLEGVSSRRGSFMAAISHNINVITTHGTSTKDDIPWKKLCFLSSANNIEQFSENALLAIQDKERANQIKKYALNYYLQNFSAQHTINKLINFERVVL